MLDREETKDKTVVTSVACGRVLVRWKTRRGEAGAMRS